MAIGAQAAPTAQRLDIPVCGFDAICAGLDAVSDGQPGPTVAQYSGRTGLLAVEYVVKAIEGKPVPGFADTGVMLASRNC
jgi:ABC-type sugar transport system substrate-binding protein